MGTGIHGKLNMIRSNSGCDCCWFCCCCFCCSCSCFWDGILFCFEREIDGGCSKDADDTNVGGVGDDGGDTMGGNDGADGEEDEEDEEDDEMIEEDDG